jgi:hypothetical protein
MCHVTVCWYDSISILMVGHVKEDKYAILDAVSRTGVEHFVVGTFSDIFVWNLKYYGGSFDV